MYYVCVDRETKYTHLICCDNRKYKSTVYKLCVALLRTTPFAETVFALPDFPQKACEMNSEQLLGYCLDNYFTVYSI